MAATKTGAMKPVSGRRAHSIEKRKEKNKISFIADVELKHAAVMDMWKAKLGGP